MSDVTVGIDYRFKLVNELCVLCFYLVKIDLSLLTF
jgi:hypothetical protein